jgi:DHA2 family multidrug resistance protein-like MFS transporter
MPAISAGRREWVGLVVLALPTLLVTMDLSVLFLAVPNLTRALHPSSPELLWITDVYGLMIAASLITMGTLGDRIGRRRLLLIGSGVFALGSLAAAFSSTPATLIVARGVLGVAGATLAPSSLAPFSA